jgi:hypothetical protein
MKFAIPFLLLLSSLSAQTTVGVRYIVRYPRAAQGNVDVQFVRDTVDAAGGTVLYPLVFPRFGYTGVVAAWTGQVPVQQVESQGLVLRVDLPLITTSGGVATPGWHRDCLVAAKLPNDPCASAPVLYVVDTGIQSSHPDFVSMTASGKLRFLPGLSAGSPPPPPYTDSLDHGTRLAGVVAGSGFGLLANFNTPLAIKSVACYEVVNPNAVTWASNCISAVYKAVDDHYLRQDTAPYFSQHASVLLFAHSTQSTTGHEGDLDEAMDDARKAGMHVVLSAGNQGNIEAVKVTPAGCGYGYKVGSNPGVRFYFGQPPLGAVYLPDPSTTGGLLVVGAHNATNALWSGMPGSNLNTSALGAVNFLAPGVSVSAPSALGGYGSYQGTSYSAATAAATVCWIAAKKPWITPTQLKGTLQSAAVASATTNYQRMVVPTASAFAGFSVSYAQWTSHYLLTGPTAALTADPDGDGMKNLQEYVCGLDPRFPDAHFNVTIQPSPALDQVQFSLPLACYLGGTGAYTVKLQESTDLLSWVTKATFTPPNLAVSPASITMAPTHVKQGDGLVHQSSLIPTSVVTRKFFRLLFN